MGVSFLKRGRAAQEAFAKAEAEAEVRNAQGKARRFWVKDGEEAVITFLDGKLTSEGLLDAVQFNEHKAQLNGSWRNYFPCTAGEEPCPLCQQNNHASLVSLFTVLDHRKWKDRAGKVHRHERKLFVAKRDTFKRLQKFASKRGGLVGWQVSISRLGERTPEVGTDFDFIEQHRLKDLAVELKLKPEDCKPFDYDEVIRYYTADELRDMGFGQHVVGQHDTQVLRKKSKRVVEDDEDEDDDDDRFSSRAKVKGRAADDDDDDDQPVARKAKRVVEDEDDDDDSPFVKKGKRPVADDDDDDDIPPAKKSRRVVDEDDEDEPAPAKKKRAPAPVDDDDDDEPAPRKKKAVVEEDDDDEPAPAKRKIRFGKKRKVVDEDDGDAEDDDGM